MDGNADCMIVGIAIGTLELQQPHHRIGIALHTVGDLVDQIMQAHTVKLFAAIHRLLTFVQSTIDVIDDRRRVMHFLNQRAMTTMIDLWRQRLAFGVQFSAEATQHANETGAFAGNFLECFHPHSRPALQGRISLLTPVAKVLALLSFGDPQRKMLRQSISPARHVHWQTCAARALHRDFRSSSPTAPKTAAGCAASAQDAASSP